MYLPPPLNLLGATDRQVGVPKHLTSRLGNIHAILWLDLCQHMVETVKQPLPRPPNVIKAFKRRVGETHGPVPRGTTVGAGVAPPTGGTISPAPPGCGGGWTSTAPPPDDPGMEAGAPPGGDG